MSLQTLFSNASAVARFEAIARSKGYTVFTKRNGFYCLSALNDFAAGFVAGMKEANDQAELEAFPPLRIPSPDLSEEGKAAFKAHWDLIQDHCASYAPAEEEPQPRKIAVIGGGMTALQTMLSLQNGSIASSRKEACDQHFGRFGDGE